MVSYRAKLGFVGAALAVLSGCGTFDRSPPPGETAGMVYVSAPRVMGRERLVNDRRDQEEWLRKQLLEVDEYNFEVNGIIDTRSLAVTAARLQARLDPAFEVYRAQQQSAADLVRAQTASSLSAERLRSTAITDIYTQLSKKEIKAEEAIRQLNELGVSYGELSVPPPSAQTPPTTPTPPSPGTAGSGASSVGSNVIGAIIDKKLNTLSPDDAKTANVSISPLDLFRDRLALREEIRSEIHETELDDTHDLAGYTIHRLTFDATVFPDNDTSAWAVVSATVEHDDALEDIWKDYGTHLERRFERMVREGADGVRNNLPSCAGITFRDQLLCAANRYYGPRKEAAIRQYLDQEENYERTAKGFPTRSSARLPADTDFRVWGRIAPQPQPSGTRLNESQRYFERLLYHVIGRLVLQEFDEENLGCFYALVPNNDATHRYPPPASADLPLEKYLPRIDELGFNQNDPETVARNRVCNYAAIPTTPSQLKKEFEDTITKNNRARVYAVTPKETVQRLSDVSSRRAAAEFLMGLSTIGGTGGVDALLQHVKENDAFLQAVRRQPLVVGYSQSAESVKVANGNKTPLSFGWILGPQFSIIKDGSVPAFRHSVRQHALTAGIIVPHSWSRVKITVKGEWRRENPDLRESARPQSFPGGIEERVHYVTLPRKLDFLDGILTSTFPQPDWEIDTTVKLYEPASLLIRGRHFWRATEVFIGSQRANKVRVLPDMGGIVAYFDKIQPLFGANKLRSYSGPSRADRTEEDAVDVWVATSNNFARVGRARVATSQAYAPRSVLGLWKRVVGGETATVALHPPLAPFRSAEVWARSSANRSMNAKVADESVGLEISRDGVSARITPKSSEIKLKAGDPIDLTLVIVTDGAIAPEHVVLAHDAVYYPNTDERKARLEWASVGAGLRKFHIIFPPNAQAGFEDLSDSKVEVSISLIVQSVEVPLESQMCQIKKGSCVLDLRSPSLPSDVKQAVDAGNFTLSVKLLGNDVPELRAATLSGK